MELYKFVYTVPVSHADVTREAIHEAGAGRLGNYSFCSFSTRGIGRFRPEKGANPSIGEIGKIEQVEEERVECICEEKVIPEVIKALKKVHPYEEIAYDFYPLKMWK